jgi:hypothetical protein
VPDVADDVVAVRSCLRLAFEGHDAVLDGDREPGGVGEELVQDHLAADLLSDLLVRAAVDG